MPQQDPSKTEQATPKRRKKAREKGNVAKSQELSKPLVLLAGMIAMRVGIGHMNDHVQGLMRYFFGQELLHDLTPAYAHHLFITCSKELGIILIPVMFTLAFMAYLNMRLQVGQLWAPKVFEFKLRLNLLSGIKRMFVSPQTIIRLLKSILQGAAVAVAAYIVLKAELFKLPALFFQDVFGIATYILESAYKMTQYALVPMLLIGIGDFFYTRWDYEENLKMTKDEVKDERKQAEGDPQIKSRQRQKMMAMMQKRMMEKVPEADVVITNPTHLAIAIKYNALEAPAPLILAKGANLIAEKIKKIARENGVPIRENKPLARALYKVVEIGDTIPEEMFQAVATILAEVYRIKNKKPGS